MTPIRPQLLLVEDEPDARGALARALTRAGYDVSEAADVAGARARLGDPAFAPEAAVLDIILGSDARGGLRALEALRARWARAPAVIVTAFADVDNVKAALNLGASHLIEKPFRAAELVAVVDRLVAARPDASEAVTRAFMRASLTAREAEVARLALKGLPSPEIAQVLGMSEKTVRQHLSRVYEKHGVSGRGELVHLLFPI